MDLRLPLLTTIALLSTSAVFLRKYILNVFTIFEVLCVTQFILSFFMIIVFTQIQWSDFYDKIKENSNSFMLNILLAIVVVLSIYFNTYMIQNYDISRMYILKTIFTLIAVFLVGISLFEEKVNSKKVLAMVLFLIGIYFMFSS